MTFTGVNTFTAGQSVTIAGAVPAGFNGTYTIASATANSFTYADTNSGLGTATTQGTAAIDLPGGITFLASTGDNGKSGGTQYPACSPNVVGVGGTTLDVSPYSESGWSGSGGGTSAYESEPIYQVAAVAASNAANNGSISTANRSIPDIAADADPYTGVGICDSWDFGSTTNCWLSGYTEGGTSLACPLWAGMMAIADEGLAISGEGSLYGSSQTLPELYSMTSDFNDITSGSNGYSAGTGYDLVTGLGSPMGNELISQMGTAVPTTTTVTSSSGSSTYGGSVTFTATVTPASGSGETGTVNFYDGSTFLARGR